MIDFETPEIRLARGNARYSLKNTVYNVEFDESKHPRGDDGKFGTGSGSEKKETSDREKDLAVVNIPLSKRGNIDAQIDKYKAEQKKKKDAEDKATFAKAKEERQAVVAKGKELFEKYGQEIIDYYSKKTGKSKTDIRALIKDWAQYHPDRLEKAIEQMKPVQNSFKVYRVK